MLSMEKLVIPSNCERIMGGVVTSDSDVKEISFEGTMNSDFEGQGLVYINTLIEKVEYPEGMTRLASSSLSREDKLVSVVLPSIIKEIGECAFPDVIEDVYIPKDAELSKYDYSNFPNIDGTVHIHKDSRADKNFDDWFQGDPHIVKVYED